MPLVFKVLFMLFLTQGKRTLDKINHQLVSDTTSSHASVPMAMDSRLYIETDTELLERVITLCLMQDRARETHREQPVGPTGRVKVWMRFDELDIAGKKRIGEELRQHVARINLEWID